MTQDLTKFVNNIPVKTFEINENKTLVQECQHGYEVLM
jgi:hypothetical protein